MSDEEAAPQPQSAPAQGQGPAKSGRGRRKRKGRGGGGGEGGRAAQHWMVVSSPDNFHLCRSCLQAEVMRSRLTPDSRELARDARTRWQASQRLLDAAEAVVRPRGHPAAWSARTG